MKLKRILSLLGLLVSFCYMYGQEMDSIITKLKNYVHIVNNLSQYIPQEKVYLHFDNTSYYHGDNIWFKCYVVTGELNKARLSKTLYVDLLNPGGEIIDKRILEIVDGQCNGDFILKSPLFYSGFYEIRAYTKYMLNFGEDAIFSRIFPVFDEPKTESDYTQREMKKQSSSYLMKRKRPHKKNKINIEFFPEGGNLIKGIQSRVAFQATNEFGEQIEITGTIVNQQKEEISHFSTIHGGRGSFLYTPTEENQKAIIRHKDKELIMDIPSASSEGFVINVDNISQPDSISISVKKSISTLPDVLGIAALSRGKVYSLTITDIKDDKGMSFNIPSKKFPTGITQIILFDKSGKIISDRLIFINKKNFLLIKKTQDNKIYEPYELVNMEFSVSDKFKNPIHTPFSLSIRDGDNEIEHDDNIITNLLLTSDIKGYIENPSYYIESDDMEHRQALDLLLMIQGWRRYQWKKLAGLEEFDLKYRPEQGVEIRGQVRSLVKKDPKPNVDVSFFLKNKNEEDEKSGVFESCRTDSLGSFVLTSNLYGKWDMIITPSEKGKKKDYNIVLDRLFRPAPRTYTYREMCMKISKADQLYTDKNEDKYSENEYREIYNDSLEKDMDVRVHQLNEITVTAKKSILEKQRETNIARSTEYYDVESELNNILDDGGYIGDDLFDFLRSVSPNFILTNRSFRYKNKYPLFVIDHQRLKNQGMINSIRLSSIKSIYISEFFSALREYADPMIKTEELRKRYGCTVFIERYPDDEVPNNVKGVRKLTLDGYSLQKEFYSPDYGTMPKEPDYRRTLYWNPSVIPNNEGKVKIQFYNNSTCMKMNISAETIIQGGIMGVYTPD